MSTVAKKSSDSNVKKAFNANPTVKLDDGRELQIPRWSVRKALAMGESIASIVQEFFSLMDVAGANDDEKEPGDFFSAIPRLMSSCGNQLASVIEESLTLPGGVQQLTKDAVLDDLSVDEFAEVLTGIVDRNLSSSTVKKWSNLFKKLPGITMGS